MTLLAWITPVNAVVVLLNVLIGVNFVLCIHSRSLY